MKANTTSSNPTVGPAIVLKPYQQAVFTGITVNVVTKRWKKLDDGTEAAEAIAGADVYLHDGATDQWKHIGQTGDEGTLNATIKFTLYGFSHQMQLRDSTGKTIAKANLGTKLNADGSDIVKSYTVTFEIKLVNPSISATLVTVRDEQLLSGLATEVFSKYAYNTASGVQYDEAAMTKISSKFDASFDDEFVNGGGTLVAAATDSEGISYHVYEFASATYMKAALSSFVTALGEYTYTSGSETKTSFAITEEIRSLYYHAISYSDKAIVDVRAFTAQRGASGSVVNRLVLAVKAAEKMPVYTGVEVWLEVDGRTVRQSDNYDGVTKNTITGASEDITWYMQNNARNYLTTIFANSQTDFVEGNRLNSDGSFTIDWLATDVEYLLKLRSADYENMDIGRATIVTDGATNVNLGEVYLVPKEVPEWIEKRGENTAASLLQGIRIRLGADISDASSMGDQQADDDAGYTEDGIPQTKYEYLTAMGESVLNAVIDTAKGQATNAVVNAITNAIGGIGGTILGEVAKRGMGALLGYVGGIDSTSQYLDARGKPIFVPWTNYVSGFEEGKENTSDSFTYIEAWISSDTINSVFSLVNNLFLPYCGYGKISIDQRYTAADLCDIPEGTDEKDIKKLNFTGIFSESREEQMYDYIFTEEALYINTVYSAGARMAPSLINFILFWALGSYLGDSASTIINLVQLVAYQIDILLDVLDQAIRLISHILPLTTAYSMILEKNLEGSPLQQEVVYATMWDNPDEWQGAYLNNKEVTTGNGSRYEPNVNGTAATIENVTLEEDISEKINQRSTNVKDLVMNEGVLDKGDNIVGYNYASDVSVQYGTVSNYNINAGYGSPYGTTVSDEPVTDDDGNLLDGYMRKLDFIDKSVYAKVVLNNAVDTLLDRIVLFLNGASYAADESGMLIGTDDYMPNGTALRADTIIYNEDGTPYNDKYAAIEAMIEEWIDTNIVNSYVIISDYRYVTDQNGVTTSYLVGKTYVRDVYGHFDNEDYLYGDISWLVSQNNYKTDIDWGGIFNGTGLTTSDIESYNFSYVSRYTVKEGTLELDYVNLEDAPYAVALTTMSAKDDRFLEIDINNTGIQLRSVSNVTARNMYSTPNNTAGMKEIPMEPPTEIIFHDPYNLLDFTAVGGSWASDAGGWRHNIESTASHPEGEYIVSSISDILPNRNYVNFTDGSSEHSAGVEIYWDFSRLDFTASDGGNAGYITGYCGNAIVGTIKVTIEGAAIDIDNPIWLEEAGYDVQSNVFNIDEDRHDPLFTLPEIDPLTYDPDEYAKLLPTYFVYARKIQYFRDGAYQTFTVNGEVRDYLLRRYVFNKIEWDLSETKVSYTGETAYVKLTYWYEPTASTDGTVLSEASDKVTIQVPVKVRNCVAQSVDMISSVQHLDLVYQKNGEMIVAVARDEYKDLHSGLNTGWISDNAGEIELGTLTTVESLISRYGTVTEYKGAYTGVKAYRHSSEDILYIVYSGVDLTEFEAYREYYHSNGLSSIVSNSDNYNSLGTLSQVYHDAGFTNTYSAEPVDNVLTIDPTKAGDVYAELSGIKWIDVTVNVTDIDNNPVTDASGNVTDTIKGWHVESVDASSLENLDLEATSHPLYEVIFKVRDNAGNVQSVTLYVNVLPKKIVENNLDETIPVREITPFATRNAASVLLGYNKGGYMIIGFYAAGVNVDSGLDPQRIAAENNALATTAWPADEIRAFGSVSQYVGTRDSLTAYKSQDGDKLYIVYAGVSRTEFDIYSARLAVAGTTDIVTLDRRAASDGLADGDALYLAKGELNPFGLPSSIDVSYGIDVDNIFHTDTLIEGKDFEWVGESEDKLRYDYGDSDTWTYTWTARIGSGDNIQEIPVEFTVYKRIPRSIDTIEVYPYSSYYNGDVQSTQNACVLSNEQSVVFSDGLGLLPSASTRVFFKIDDSGWRDKVTGNEVVINGETYLTDVKFVEPSFDGSFYFVTVLLYDEVFGYTELRNIRIILRKSTVSDLRIPEKEVYLYNADADIDALLAQEGIRGTIYQIGNVTIGTDAFEIVSWDYVTEGGFKSSYTFSGDDYPRIKVTIANKGYSAGNRIWVQDVTVTLTEKMLPNRVIDRINDVEVNDDEGNKLYSIERDASGKYIFSVADPYKFTMPSELGVTFAGTIGTGNVPAVFDFGTNANDFYKEANIEGTVTLGAAENNKVTFAVIYRNGKVRENVTVTYYTDAGCTDEYVRGTDSVYNAFDVFELPVYAKISVKNESGETVQEDNVYDVTWKSVEAYGPEGGTVEAVAWIGYPVYGYIVDTLELTINEEHIVDYTMPNTVTLNPYAPEGVEARLDSLIGAEGNKLEVVTSLGRTLKLDVNYPELKMDYRETKVNDITVSVGNTLTFGGVESVVDESGNSAGNKLDVREELPLSVIVESRVAVGVSTWYTSSTTNLTGSIYEPIDFEALGRMTVVAVATGDRRNDASILGNVSGYEFFSDKDKLAAEWPAELIEWSRSTEYAKLDKGQLTAVYYVDGVYYMLYRGNTSYEAAGALTLNGYSETVSGDNHIYYYSGDGGITVNVRSYEEGVTVLFESAQEEKYDLTWNTSGLTYSFAGGTYTVLATLDNGIEGMAQTFAVKVYLRSVSLSSVGVTTAGVSEDSVVRLAADGRTIEKLVVDPYIGFVGLPDRVMATFADYASPVELAVTWQYRKIVNAMTTAGGEYNRDNNMAAIASIYVLDAEGSRTAVQSIEIPVTVIRRDLQGVYVSKYASSADYNAAVSAGLETGDEFTQFSFTMTINPYTTAYSEDFNSESFAYFRRILLVVSKYDGEVVEGNLIPNHDGKEIVYELDSSNYNIRDIATNAPTDTTNLYTGRTVNIALTFGATSDSAASDARQTRGITATILNMTYVGGLSTGYTLDVYGVTTDDVDVFTDIPVFAGIPDNEMTVTSSGTVEIATVSGIKFFSEVLYDRTDALTIFDGRGNKAGTIGVAGGMSRLYATIGNELGGMQNIVIPLTYLDRTVTKLFGADESEYAYDTDYSGMEAAELHFEIDPFAVYDPASIYPQTGSSVTFGDGTTGGKFTTAEVNDGIKVVWDDSKVIRTYRGSNTSSVKATISYNGKFEQVVNYKVIVYDRTVTGFTKLLLDENAKIRPYLYNNSEDVSKDVAEDYLIPAGTQFTVMFDNIPRNPEQYTITFTLGAGAQYFSTGGAPIELTSAESALTIQFVLDSARGLGHKGKDARFYITIPGFALGAEGQQQARQDIPCEESYIMGLRFYNGIGSEDDPANYTWDYTTWLLNNDVSSNGMFVQSPTVFGDYYYDTYIIRNPYTFISNGGVLLPEQALVYVGKEFDSSADQYDIGNATYSFLVETNWTNIVNNRTRIYYNKEEHQSAFQIDLDGQSYAIRFQVSQEWILDSAAGEDLLFIENYKYGKEEIILMPGQNAVNSNANLVVTSTYNDLGNAGITSNDIYEITFNGGKFKFEGVAGGGSYSDNYMKWNFDSVNWNASSTTMQYATLTLGGKGGQTVRWGFYVDSAKKLVNNSIVTAYAIEEGASVTLQRTYKQLFSGSTLNASREIPVQYSSAITPYYRDQADSEGNSMYPLGLTYNNGSYTVYGTMNTPSAHRSGDGSGYTGYILWDATELRAYPSPKYSIGGTVVFSVHQSPNTYDYQEVQDAGAGNNGNPYMNLQNYGLYLHNPTASYGFGELRPILGEGWTYPTDMPSTGNVTQNTTSYKLPSTGYRVVYSSNNYRQSSVPVITVTSDAMFDMRYLPMVSVTEYLPTVEVRKDIFSTTTYAGYDYDLMYLVPWYNADVYFTKNKNNSANWNPSSNVYGEKVSGGIAAINTGSANVDGRYTLVCKMTFGSETVTLICSIDIVRG